MSKIKMLKTHTGALDGVSIKKFDKGMIYSVPDQISIYLSELFLNMGVAKIAREKNIYEKVEPSAPVEAPEVAVVEVPEIKESTKPEAEKIEETEEKKIQIYMLASELNVPWKKIVEIAKKFNIGVKNHMSVLSEEEVITIKKSLI